MDSDSEGAARSAPRPSPLQALRRQWRERQLSPVQQTPTRRLADLLAAAESPERDCFGDRPGSSTAELGDRSWQAYVPDAEPHRPGDLTDKEPGACVCLGEVTRSVLPQPPGEEAFVAARASVRRDEYLKLEMWLLAGGSPEPFAPWFRELLMDADAEAFVAACRAVASHYRRTAQQHALGLDTTAAPCRPWLKGFLERLQSPGSAERLKEAAELAAAVLAAPRPSSTSQRHEFFDELALLLPTPGAEALLRGCEGHGALQMEDLEQLRSMVAPAPLEPDVLEVPRSPSVEHNSLFASPLRPKASGLEDPLRLLGTSSPKSWRQRLEALEAIQGPDADGVHGQLLWPQLVLQAEDDHPAVAAASLHCLARLAPLLSAPGDHLLARLAWAVKARAKGRLRDQEAVRVLLGATARCPRAVGGPAGLGAFLGLALGLQKDRAKEVVLELMAERHQPAGAAGCLPAPLEALLQDLGKLRPPEIRRGGLTLSESPVRKRALCLGSPEFCRQSPRISPVQKATPSTTSPGAFLSFAEALPDPDSVPPLCRYASPVKPWKQVRHWEARTPDTTRGSATSLGPSLPSESRLLSLSQAPSPEYLGETQSTVMGTSPEDQEEPISPEAPRKESEDEAEPDEDKDEDTDDEAEGEEEARESLESFLKRLAAETPQDLAKALAKTWSDEAARVVDILLSLLLATSGASSAKTAELLQSFVEELVSTDRHFKDLDLPSLPMVAEAASAGRLGTALPALRRALEPLLRHLSPGAVPESCWTQLRRILADRPAQMGEEAAEAVKEEMQVPAAELAELSATFQKLHRITTELSRPVQNMDEVLLPLRQAAQILLRPQAHGPLRGFLRRLRLRRGAKENVVPQTKTGRLQKPPADDYACAREQAADEGLVGAFPSSLFGPLRRLLAGPAPVQRGAAEVVAACARACGAPLLRGLLGLAPLLLKVVSFRGPAQGAARAALAEMSSQSWSGFRATWRALMQAILASSGGRRSPGLSGMVDQGSGQLLEVFRALEEVWPQLSETSDAAAARQALGELLAVAAPCCLHSSSQLRTAAARALRGAAAAVGAEAVEEELNAAPASVAAIGAARAALQATESGPAPIRCAPSAARSSPLIPDCAVRAEVTPGPSRPRRLNFSPKPSERGCERSVQRSRRSKSLVPVQVDAQSPAPEGTRDASELEADIEAAMEELAAGSQLTESTDWPGRISMLRMRLQEIASRSCNGVPSSLLRTMLVLLWRLALGAEASESEELSASLLKAVCEAAAACRSFPAEAFVGLGTGAPFQCLLQTLACLQTLSQQSSAGIRRASGPALLELPPLLAQTMDAVEADSQFVAWLRVARELLSDPSSLEPLGEIHSREDRQALCEWALRFCLRGAQRCANAVSQGSGITAWEVLSEMTALYEVLETRAEGDWLQLLEGVALQLAQTRRAEAVEFARLAAVAGRPMLACLKQLAGRR